MSDQATHLGQSQVQAESVHAMAETITRLKADKAELLEALEAALSGLEYCVEFTSLPFSARSKKLNPIRAAIARAKGES
jgi:hypothetical protein